MLQRLAPPQKPWTCSSACAAAHHLFPQTVRNSSKKAYRNQISYLNSELETVQKLNQHLRRKLSKLYGELQSTRRQVDTAHDELDATAAGSLHDTDAVTSRLKSVISLQNRFRPQEAAAAAAYALMHTTTASAAAAKYEENVVALQDTLYRATVDGCGGTGVSTRSSDALNQAVASIRRHNRYFTDGVTLCLYCDGSNGGGRSGAAVCAPTLRYLRVASYVNGRGNPVTIGPTELFGVVLALESAAELAAPGQPVAVFCDNQGAAGLEASVWFSDDLSDDLSSDGAGLLGRAERAAAALERKGCAAAVCWLARASNAAGASLAHGGSRLAARREGVQDTVYTEKTWILQNTLAEALREARAASSASDM